MTPLVLMFDYFRLLEKHFAVKTIWLEKHLPDNIENTGGNRL